jgi:hypothetical protein
MTDNGLANTAFLLGLAATLVGLAIPQFGWLVFGVPLGVGALVFGIGGIRRARERGGRRLAVIGIVLGVAGPPASLLLWILAIEVFDIPCC